MQTDIMAIVLLLTKEFNDRIISKLICKAAGSEILAAEFVVKFALSLLYSLPAYRPRGCKKYYVSD